MRLRHKRALDEETYPNPCPIACRPNRISADTGHGRGVELDVLAVVEALTAPKTEIVQLAPGAVVNMQAETFLKEETWRDWSQAQRDEAITAERGAPKSNIQTEDGTVRRKHIGGRTGLISRIEEHGARKQARARDVKGLDEAAWRLE